MVGLSGWSSQWRNMVGQRHWRRCISCVIPCTSVGVLESQSAFAGIRYPFGGGCFRDGDHDMAVSAFLLVPPPPGWLKINVDGSLLPSRLAGLCAVIRTEVGRVVTAASFSWVHWDPGQVELEVVRAIRRLVQPELLDV
ncbi:hypothetical protein KSP40_PGU001970 [Platanthera guangdongensis]|uniref:RNase H type-1 domain-containing protein n=1 Tax=Platanthera guangdongensis TaxID=2320717 RepID=A0ABR2LXL0_9ASPA